MVFLVALYLRCFGWFVFVSGALLNVMSQRRVNQGGGTAEPSWQGYLFYASYLSRI